MRQGLIATCFGLSLLAVPLPAQDPATARICVDYFGAGMLQDETCRPFPGAKVKIGPADIVGAVSQGVFDLKIVSEKDPGEAFDLAPLAQSETLHSLNLFRVGPADLSPLQDVEGLRRLHLGADAALGLNRITADLPDLVELDIYAPNRSVDLSALAHMPNLRVISVDADGISGQEHLSGLRRLERARFRLVEETDFSAMSGLGQLEWLEISGKLGRSVLSDIAFVSPLNALTHLDLSGNRITDLNALSELTSLRLLVLSYNTSLASIAPLAALTGLTTLQLRGTRVTDLTPLGNMQELGILWLRRTPVADISVLGTLPNVWGLELDHTQVTDISPLRSLPLRHLSLRGTKVEDFSAVPAGTKLKK